MIDQAREKDRFGAPSQPRSRATAWTFLAFDTPRPEPPTALAAWSRALPCFTCGRSATSVSFGLPGAVPPCSRCRSFAAGGDEAALRAFVADRNERRELSAGQKAMIGLEIAPYLEAAAKEPQAQGRKRGGGDNRILNFNDPSGAVTGRFVKVNFPVSFWGREDAELKATLRAELSGIAVRFVRAYRRLCDRGRFVQPASATALEADVLKASDPFTAMAMECFVPDPAGMIVKALAYDTFTQWCKDNGRLDILRTTPKEKFGERLRGVLGFEGLADGPRPHGKPRTWVGIAYRRGA